MFGRKKCPKCNARISKKYNFCPHCGLLLKEGERFFEPSFNLGFPFNAIFKQLGKKIEKELKNLDKEMDTPLLDKGDFNPVLGGLTIKIDSVNGNPLIKVGTKGSQKEETNKKLKDNVGLRTNITEKKAREISKLPKEEAKASMRRLTDRIIYFLELPQVKKENIFITKLHNSIEVKAFSRDRVYFKLIPLSMPILNSSLEDGKLILEFKL